MTASAADRFAASRPTPKPGLMDIHAYVGGKSKIEGVAHPVKLSSNENVLGCSDAAKDAYRAAVDRLHIYPDGKANILREAVAAHYGLEPERLTFGDGSDEIFALLCQVYLEPGDNIVQGEHGFAAYAIGARACQGEVAHGPRAQPAHRRRCAAGRTAEATPTPPSGQPRQPDRHLDTR